MKPSFTLKINVVLVPAMALVLAGVLIAVKRIADRTALEETDRTARLMMAAAQATFDYTVEQIKPALEAKYQFLVQSVSSYAATETIGRMQNQFHDYRYHVAALNPTNKRDLADAWETAAIQSLAQSGAPEFTEVRTLDRGRFDYIAVPVRITNDACLTCHSVPDAAPRIMLDTYGRGGGFGWKLNEVIGAQVVSVPMSVAQRRADGLFRGVVYLLVVAFAAVLFVANVIIYLVATRRLARLSRVADRVSRGDVDVALSSSGSDLLSLLEQSFERMRVSLKLAMQVAPRPVTPVDWPLPAAAMELLKSRLAAQWGPLVSMLVDRAAEGAPSRREFIERLLQTVPDGEQAKLRQDLERELPVNR
jgi:protein-histidine pros-kinase